MARNEAITITWLKSYLNFGEDRPLWAFVADELLARKAHISDTNIDELLRYNTYLQTWNTKSRELSADLASMVDAAKDHGLKMEGIAISREIQRAVPIWFHQKSTANRTLFTGGTHHKNTIRCLRHTHSMVSTGDAEILARKLRSIRHRSAWNCRCDACQNTRLNHPQCRDPNACFKRAKLMLDSLLPKWNPLLPQPEDWETDLERVPTQDENTETFNPKVTTHGTLADTFRIFTNEEVGGDEAPDTKLDPEPDEEEIVVYTDGSAINNGKDDAKAGSGIYFGDGDIRNMAIRIPDDLGPSNQVAEMLA
ncbi:hypothetical protein B0H19DRAFT_965261, partial [Mycena capillaripes]